MTNLTTQLLVSVPAILLLILAIVLILRRYPGDFRHAKRIILYCILGWTIVMLAAAFLLEK